LLYLKDFPIHAYFSADYLRSTTIITLRINKITHLLNFSHKCNCINGTNIVFV
uniref:Ovule protein n=1 Tax=Rodentolepis nana TaxID=102285 RepID=A0A0R3TTC1_RODNA